MPPDSTAATPLDAIALHDTAVVSPGLLIRCKSIRRPRAGIIRDPGDIPLVFTIEQHHRVIYRDTTDGLAVDEELADPAVRKDYPLWIPTGRDAGELLIAYNNRPSKDRAQRFTIRAGRVAKLDTLPTFDGPAKNLDKDGQLEYGGRADYGENWEDERGRHRQSYNPVVYYEICPTGLVLDSALTRRRAVAQYGAFYGYRYSAKPIILKK